MERERRPNDDAHERRWRRKPFAPARVDRPRESGPGADDRWSRDPEPRGGADADADRPPPAG